MVQSTTLHLDTAVAHTETSAPSKAFISTPSGRILTGIVGLNIVAMGLLAMGGFGEAALWLVASVPFAGILAGIFAVGLSTLEDNPDATLAMIVSLPFVGGFSFALLSAASTAGEGVGVVMFVVGAIVLASLARKH
jgi:hypothetical protein